MPIETLTFGCRLNAYESEVMRQQAESAGLETLESGAILVNTCAVTGEAVRQARQAIRRARRKNPTARIIVSGCAAQTMPETFADMPEVDLVLGNEEKLDERSYRKLPDFGVNDFEKVRVNDIMSVKETASHMVQSVDGHTRAFVQVQNGCDHRCTFCIIPFGRGNSRSVPAGEVAEQARRLVSNGYREIVLTGVDTTSWGADLPGSPRLGHLVRSVLKAVPEIERLRLSSIDSIEVDETLLDLIANEPRLMPHLHLSLQHGDDLILKRMKRRHSSTDAVRFCDTVRELRPDLVFGADLMAGFPTETDDMHKRNIEIVDACGLTFLHVFPFSPRPDTPAAKMPQVSRTIINERAAELRSKGKEVLEHHLNGLVGTKQNVLMERGGIGRIKQFTAVAVEDAGLVGHGIFAEVMITGHDGKRLIGRLAENDCPAKGEAA